MCKPVSEKGTDEIFSILGHLCIVRKDERVMVVHDLPIGSNERLSIEWSFTYNRDESLKPLEEERYIKKENRLLNITYQLTIHIEKLQQTTSHIPDHRCHHCPETGAPQGRCSLVYLQLSHSAPYQSVDRKTHNITQKTMSEGLDRV